MISPGRRTGLLAMVLYVAFWSQAGAAPLMPISFSPGRPAAGDVVTASVSSIAICGVPAVSIAGSNIAIVNSPAPPCDYYPILSVSLGTLPAGTYQVTWSAATDVVPAPDGTFAAGTLVVDPASPAPAPALSPAVALALALGLGVLGLRRIGARLRPKIFG
jgi:hypothetical protein